MKKKVTKEYIPEVGDTVVDDRMGSVGKIVEFEPFEEFVMVEFASGLEDIPSEEFESCWNKTRKQWELLRGEFGE